MNMEIWEKHLGKQNHKYFVLIVHLKTFDTINHSYWPTVFLYILVKLNRNYHFNKFQLNERIL